MEPPRLPGAGDFVLVQYGIEGPRELHERLLLSDVLEDQRSYAVATPHGDEYDEDLTGADGMISNVWATLVQGLLPFGVREAEIVRFTALPARLELLDMAARAARRHGVPAPRALVPNLGGHPEPAVPAAHRVPLADAAPGGPRPPAGPRAGARDAGGAERGGEDGHLRPGPPRGDGARPAGAADLPGGGGGGGLQALAAALAGPQEEAGGPGAGDPEGDARTVAVCFDEAGQRFREYREGVRRCSEETWGDWPIRGPRTVVWLLRFFRDNGGSPVAYFSKFKAEGKLNATDPGIDEMERACRCLETMICYDQLNAGNIACAELLARSIQMVAEKYRERFVGDKEGSEERHLLMGTHAVRGNLPICPLLSDWLSDELRKEAAVMKERRKAREERQLLKPPKPPSK